jgi:small subunit ribosomal protein S16
MGSKRRAYYRLVATDSRKSVTGTILENLGHYAPIEKPARVIVDEEKIFKWLNEGAQPSDTVASLFTQIGLTKKYLAQKAGQDVSEMTIETTITEKPKKRKPKKKAE